MALIKEYRNKNLKLPQMGHLSKIAKNSWNKESQNVKNFYSKLAEDSKSLYKQSNIQIVLDNHMNEHINESFSTTTTTSTTNNISTSAFPTTTTATTNSISTSTFPITTSSFSTTTFTTNASNQESGNICGADSDYVQDTGVLSLEDITCMQNLSNGYLPIQDDVSFSGRVLPVIVTFLNLHMK